MSLLDKTNNALQASDHNNVSMDIDFSMAYNQNCESSTDKLNSAFYLCSDFKKPKLKNRDNNMLNDTKSNLFNQNNNVLNSYQQPNTFFNDSCMHFILDNDKTNKTIVDSPSNSQSQNNPD